jgi:2-C-methyl-D-erythritol 4-phosphate cytidylyltransferase/2-C-methyl-D-erythritol 2,4-cyclodiphosphate synthase
MSAVPGRVAAIVAAAGQGTRFGGRKQFALLGGRSVLARSVSAAVAHADELVVVVPAGEEQRAGEEIRPLSLPIPHQVIAGRSTRAGSVRSGLQALGADCRWVLIHDGVRPCATPDLFRRVLSAAMEVGAAVPVLPCSDTLKRVEGARVVETVDRAVLRLAQTPQGFEVDRLRRAHELLGDGSDAFTDEAGLCEAAGFPVAAVQGEAGNVKITHAADLARLEQVERGLARPRIGFGFDCHPFAKGRSLVLGGVTFPGDGLQGHSDADVVAHAVADALLGAAGLGDLGRHFPEGDPATLGADSLELLSAVGAKVRRAGFRLENVDLTVAARRPRIAPEAEAMCAKLAAALDIERSRVNVKATSGDGLGFVGRAEGIAAQAVALLWTI